MASVELQQFRGRLFVVGPSWGTEVPPEAAPRQVGELLMRGLEGERARRRPFIETLAGMARRDRAERRGWERFLSREAGVEPAEYRPEKRVDILDLDEGVLHVRRISAGVADQSSELHLPADIDAERLGEAALSLVSQIAADWPAVRGAWVYGATRKRLAVVPTRTRSEGPIRIVATDADPRVVGEAVQAALVDSEKIDPEIDSDLSGSWDRLLADAGLSRRQLAGRRSVDVDELSEGSIRVSAWRYVRGGWEPIGEHAEVTLSNPTPERLGRAVLVAAFEWDHLSGSHLGSAL